MNTEMITAHCAHCGEELTATVRKYNYPWFATNRAFFHERCLGEMADNGTEALIIA